MDSPPRPPSDRHQLILQASGQDHWAPVREAACPAVTVQVAQTPGGLAGQGLCAWSSVPELVMPLHHMQEQRPPKAVSHLLGWHSRAPPGTKPSDLRHMGREAPHCPTDSWINPNPSAPGASIYRQIAHLLPAHPSETPELRKGTRGESPCFQVSVMLLWEPHRKGHLKVRLWPHLCCHLSL